MEGGGDSFVCVGIHFEVRGSSAGLRFVKPNRRHKGVCYTAHNVEVPSLHHAASVFPTRTGAHGCVLLPACCVQRPLDLRPA
eukprot:scaffold6788_cov134-Pinguiococcus_pyrenoidosus.AAC.1